MKLTSNKRSLTREAQAKTRATEMQWELLDIAIKAFITKYPRHWFEFVRQNKQIAEAQKFQKFSKNANKAWHKGAHWTQSLSFPTILDVEGNEVDSLYPTIEKIIPCLTHKNSINYDKFLKRYPDFKTMDYTK
jgi:hypothetical protein